MSPIQNDVYLLFLLAQDLPLYDDKTGDSWAPVEIEDETWVAD